ncbi:protein FAM173B isoform X2 [Alligator sinensis]|uniref:Protein FAM173B isoform X2 n=1 Tax=Alligator sinensis TaxID=38654 RepID=A0A1U7RJX3_ALLSI|nr:protein FAM173B isoform X2 [Alligator sinensis]
MWRPRRTLLEASERGRRGRCPGPALLGGNTTNGIARRSHPAGSAAHGEGDGAGALCEQGGDRGADTALPIKSTQTISSPPVPDGIARAAVPGCGGAYSLARPAREVIAAAKEGFRAVGYELNPWLVWYSRYCAWREGVHHDAKFYISDLWKVRFSQYTNVVIFGVPQLMPQLEKKLEDELEHDARVIACRFPFPHWMPDYTTGEIPNRSYHFFVLKMLVDTEKGRLTVWPFHKHKSRDC